MLLEVRVNGQTKHKPFGLLRDRETVELSLPYDAVSKHGGFYLFQNRLIDFEPDMDFIERMKGKETNLGRLPSLVQRNLQNHTFKTEPGMLYDTLFVYGSHMLDSSRFSTGNDLPGRLSIDEVKYLIIRRAGMTPKEVEDISAKVLYEPSGIPDAKYTHGLKIGGAIISVMPSHAMAHHYSGSTPKTLREHIRPTGR